MIVLNIRPSPARCTTQTIMTVIALHYLTHSSRISKRGTISENTLILFTAPPRRCLWLTLLVVALLDEEKILYINELNKYNSGASLTSPEDIKKLSKITPKPPKTMKIFMEKLKVFEKLIYALLSASWPPFVELRAIIRSLIYYRPAAQAFIKRIQRASIEWIINHQNTHFFRGETNQLAEFFLMKNNLRACNPLIYHAELPITLYGEDSLPTHCW